MNERNFVNQWGVGRDTFELTTDPDELLAVLVLGESPAQVKCKQFPRRINLHLVKLISAECLFTHSDIGSKHYINNHKQLFAEYANQLWKVA